MQRQDEQNREKSAQEFRDQALEMGSIEAQQAFAIARAVGTRAAEWERECSREQAVEGVDAGEPRTTGAAANIEGRRVGWFGHERIVAVQGGRGVRDYTTLQGGRLWLMQAQP